VSPVPANAQPWNLYSAERETAKDVTVSSTMTRPCKSPETARPTILDSHLWFFALAPEDPFRKPSLRNGSPIQAGIAKSSVFDHPRKWGTRETVDQETTAQAPTSGGSMMHAFCPTVSSRSRAARVSTSTSAAVTTPRRSATGSRLRIVSAM
jgi:hypothetical protein